MPRTLTNKPTCRLRLPSCGTLPEVEVELLDEYHNTLESWTGGELELGDAQNRLTFTGQAENIRPHAARQTVAQSVASFAHLNYVSAGAGDQGLGDIDLVIRAVPKKKAKGLAVRLEEIVLPATLVAVARVVDVELKVVRGAGQVCLRYV
jgi:hypothetical protein